LYQFTRLPNTALARKLGVHHGIELAYVFGNMANSEGYNEIDRELSRKMMDYWVNFARTGNPNGKHLPYWPAYKSKSDLNLEFSGIIKTNKHLFKKKCDFISRQSTYRFE
jgi:para-nitrobenzyl esterase